MVRGGGGGEQKRGRKRVKNNSESAKKRREQSRNASAASYQGLRARDLGYGKPAQKAARKLAYSGVEDRPAGLVPVEERVDPGVLLSLIHI